MGEKINYEQLENLLSTMFEHNIPSAVITNLLNIGCLAELSVVQYNYLLLIMKGGCVRC